MPTDGDGAATALREELAVHKADKQRAAKELGVLDAKVAALTADLEEKSALLDKVIAKWTACDSCIAEVSRFFPWLAGCARALGRSI